MVEGSVKHIPCHYIHMLYCVRKADAEGLKIVHLANSPCVQTYIMYGFSPEQNQSRSF